jgi:hypothetical protein
MNACSTSVEYHSNRDKKQSFCKENSEGMEQKFQAFVSQGYMKVIVKEVRSQVKISHV